MLTRRKLVLGAALAALVPAAPALAAPDPLLADILYGVSDALIRDYIYRNYEYGRWDGRYYLRAEGLREDRVRGHRSLRTVRARARRISAVPADAAAPQPAPRRA